MVSLRASTYSNPFLLISICDSKTDYLSIRPRSRSPGLGLLLEKDMMVTDSTCQCAHSPTATTTT